MQLRGEMVALSMQAAGKIIAANMDNKTNEKLVSDFIDQLDKDKWVDCHAEFTVSKKIRCGNV